MFGIRPSAFKSTVAQGEIVDHDLLIQVRPMSPDVDVAAYVKTQLGEVEWRLSSLRGSMEHMNQQLEATIRACIAHRKRAVENKTRIGQKISIPRRQSPIASVQKVDQKAVPRPKVTNQPKPEPETWDIFMSHASPDKPYVEPLVDELKKAGVKVWYDKHVLGWGEQLRPGINRGLVNSTFAIVVLSKAFLAERKWTEHELNALFAREELGKLVILPIWHGITREDLLKYDPALADRLAKISDTDSYPDIVASVLQKLGRASPQIGDVKGPVKEAKPERADGPETRELVAFAWYETKGDNARREKLYVRKSSFMPGWYVLIDGEKEHEGTLADVSGKFFAGDRYLKSGGFVQMNFSNPSNLKEFDI